MAYCAHCGRELSPAAIACPNCGHPGPGAAPAIAPGKRTEGFAIASIVCSVTSFFFLPIVGGILGIIFGHVARRRIAEDPDLGGAEIARAGIIVGWIASTIWVLFIVLLIVFTFTTQGGNF